MNLKTKIRDKTLKDQKTKTAKSGRLERYDSEWMIQRSNEIGRCKHGALCFVCEKVIHDISWNNAPLCNYCFLQSLKQNYPERTLMIEHFENLVKHNSKYDILRNA